MGYPQAQCFVSGRKKENKSAEQTLNRPPKVPKQTKQLYFIDFKAKFLYVFE
ncbi:MAG: hypothetical protein J6V53_04150 [Alphaproteobacteria bacterium]|nr:hypothetical protein [Alphaproteobacteria bacterium]